MGYIGVITHLLTIDPNFLGHPSNPKKINIGCMGRRYIYLHGWLNFIANKQVDIYEYHSHGSYGYEQSSNKLLT